MGHDRARVEPGAYGDRAEHGLGEGEQQGQHAHRRSARRPSTQDGDRGEQRDDHRRSVVSSRLVNSTAVCSAAVVVRDGQDRARRALGRGGAAQARAGQADHAAGHDDPHLDHDVGDQQPPATRSSGLSSAAARPVASGRLRGRHVSSSTGRSGRPGRRPPRARRAGRARAARSSRPCWSAVAQAVAERARRQVRRQPAAGSRAWHRAGHDHRAAGEQQHPDQVGDGQDGLGPQQPGQQRGPAPRRRPRRPRGARRPAAAPSRCGMPALGAARPRRGRPPGRR